MKKRVAGVLLAGLVLMSTSFTFAQSNVQNDRAEVKFNDISEHWSAKAVQSLVQKDAIPFGQDKFIPGKAITRSEFAIMLHRALDIQINYFKEPDIKDYFDDVRQDDPYTSAVIDLVTAGVFEGKGSFKPQASISREEMVHYVMGAYKYMRGEEYAMIKIGSARFKDADKITPEYSGEVAMAQHYKLITGTGNNLFQPEKSASRAEAAVVINNLVKLLDEQNRPVIIKPDATLTKDSIEMKISIINNTKKSITINYSSGQKFDFALLDEDRNVLYRWSADKLFTMELNSTTIEPGKTQEFSDTLSGEAYTAIKDKVVYLKAYITGKSDTLVVDNDGYEIKVKQRLSE